MQFYDKNYQIIREHDKVILDCKKCEIIDCEDEVKCTVQYDDQQRVMICRDSDDNEYIFKYDDSDRVNNINCLSVVVAKDEDSECML